MKTIKIFAMLFAASILTFTLTACGDDADEPAPDKTNDGQTEQPTPNAQGGTLKINNEEVKYTFGMAHAQGDAGINIMFETEENGKTSSLAIQLRNVSLQNGKLPAGNYPLLTRSNEENLSEKPCFYLSGSLNIAMDDDRNYTGGYFFNATEGSSSMAIAYDGTNYTLTIASLELSYREAADPSYEYKTAKTTFAYKGQLNIRSMQ